MTLGKLVNICGDVGEIDNVAEGTIKALTAGNMMMFDRKTMSGIEAVPTARLMIACNNLPRFRDRSQGIWRRAMISPWRIAIPRHERIKNMDKAEWWEATGERSGMFKWALLGLARLRQQGGFTDSVVMDQAKEEYQLDSNPAKQFLLENLVAEEGAPLIKSTWIYQRYRNWAISGGYHPLSERPFGKELARAFPETKKIRRGRRDGRVYCYTNLAIAEGVVPWEEQNGAFFDGTY